MILNLSKIKTEALLLFCKDLILSYKDSELIAYDENKSIEDEIQKVTQEFLEQIEKVTFPSEHYLENRKHYRIKAVLDGYNYINKSLSQELKEDTLFNPAMLYFSLLAVWFKELDKESRSKEYIYFILYPYANVYDKLLLNLKDEEFKKMNIQMIEIAERVVLKLDKLSFSRT